MAAPLMVLGPPWLELPWIAPGACAAAHAPTDASAAVNSNEPSTTLRVRMMRTHHFLIRRQSRSGTARRVDGVARRIGCTWLRTSRHRRAS